MGKVNTLIQATWEFIDGKKSYISAILLVIWSGLFMQGYIDQKTYEIGMSILGALGIASVRHAVSKLE